MRQKAESTEEVGVEPPAYKPFSIHNIASKPALLTADTQPSLPTGAGLQLPLGGPPRDNISSRPLLDHQAPPTNNFMPPPTNYGFMPQSSNGPPLPSAGGFPPAFSQRPPEPAP